MKCAHLVSTNFLLFKAKSRQKFHRAEINAYGKLNQILNVIIRTFIVRLYILKYIRNNTIRNSQTTYVDEEIQLL